MSFPLRFFLSAGACCSLSLCVSCLPMFGAHQMLAASHLADGLLSSSPLELVWRGKICSSRLPAWRPRADSRFLQRTPIPS